MESDPLTMNSDLSDTDVLLTLNIGSSSVKFAGFSATDATRRLLAGQFDDRDGQLRWTHFGEDGEPTHQQSFELPLGTAASRRDDVLQQIVELFRPGERSLRSIVHRVVHGGTEFTCPVLIDQHTLEALEELSAWAPLHQPACLRAIRLSRQLYPNIPQLACFDTAFHQTLPQESFQFAIPHFLTERGIRRYGFHGLSFQSVLRRLQQVAPDLAKGRVVVAHLGGGSSLCGMRNGRSIGTTMGLTPLDGLPMATRCGSLDPGVVLHLMRGERMTVEQISQLLYRESGLLGVSQNSGDMRTLLAAASPESKDAVRLFVHHVAREIGALFVDLHGLDGLVFTGGIGENSAEIRQMVCQQLDSLGIAIDLEANTHSNSLLTASGSQVAVWRLKSDEESEMAHQAISYFNGQESQKPSPQGD
jgi:acetate kinase